MTIYCTGCEKDVEARLTDGKEMYPHRPDLQHIPFWKHDSCGAFVGCHWKTNDRTKPLGVLASKELREARKKIHAVLDPIWKTGKMKRGQTYAYVGERLGRTFHNGELRSLDEAREVYRIVARLHNGITAAKKS